ncbi:MAG TPA: diguanylate cyclase [Candidatus Deferrimicrobiaceae bacterium]|jgi:diguanylate cyclase (GGDEF)-like protein
MRSEGVLAWVIDGCIRPGKSLFDGVPLSFSVTLAHEPDPPAMLARLKRESHDVLCIEDAPPFERSRDLLHLTDALPMRPVIITIAPDIDVPTAVLLMEIGVFSVISDVADSQRLSAAVNRALSTRRAMQQIVNMNVSLRRSRSVLEKKTVALSAERIKLRRKASEVSLMRRVAEWLGRARTLEEGLSEVLAPLAAFVGAARGVFLVNPEKGRWIVCGGESAPIEASTFPRAAALFRRAERIAVSESGGLTMSPAPETPGSDSGVALPVRIKRRFLGYGIFWGGEVPAPSADTLRLLEAVGVQVGAFCENIVLREQVATERDRLGHAKDELDFLFRFASALNEDLDLDAVFEWLCRELGRFVPYAGIEFLSMLGRPEVRTCGVGSAGVRDRKIAAALARQWRKQMPPASGTEAGESLVVKEFPYGEAAGSAPAGIHRWTAPLTFGESVLGSLAVHLVPHVSQERARERVLRSVTAQLSLFLHNFAEREKVRVMASNDGLTGLFNYRSFQDRFDREFEWFLRRERNLAVLMIDIDHFKGINDTFGHQVGDQMLRGVAEILLQNLRKTDYAFRYGGDEFVVLMPDAGLRQAEIFAQRVRTGVRTRLQGVSPYEFQLSVSIGIADCTVLVSREQEELLKRADGALYQAKSRGRDRIQVADAAVGAGHAKEEVRGAEQT